MKIIEVESLDDYLEKKPNICLSDFEDLDLTQIPSKYLKFLMFAGNSTICVKSKNNYIYFNVEKICDFWKISSFINNEDPKYIATVRYNNSYYSVDNISENTIKQIMHIKSFEYILNYYVNSIELGEPDNLIFYHNGICCKCGKELEYDMDLLIGIHEECL